jgi:secreted trypsin-like serine protease
VHRSYVVTAAHCVDYATPELLVAGDQNSAMMDARTEQHLHAEKVFKHPDFSRKDLTNDIAVIKLREPVEWTDWVQPVCLPGPQENLKEGSPGYLVGWGYDDHYGEPTEDLHSVRLPIVSNEQCQNYLGSRINIRDSHLCAGHEEGQRDGCGVIELLFFLIVGVQSRNKCSLWNVRTYLGKGQLRLTIIVQPHQRYQDLHVVSSRS